MEVNNIKLSFYKISLKSYIVVSFLIFFIIQSKSQSLQRQSIACCGTYMINNGTLIQQTVGQPYGTTASYDNSVTYRPGFQQPVFKLEFIHANISLKVFPNPATRVVTIESSTMLTDVLVQVNDMSGKILVSQKISEFNSISFNCENWANGFYTISVSDSKNNEYSTKLIISR